MRRILITQLSPLPRTRSVTRYRVTLPDRDTDYIEAVQTNESIIRCLSHLQTIKNGGGIDVIIVLGTRQTNESVVELFGNMTAFQYYEHVVEECGFTPEYLCLNIDDIGITETFSQICSEIKRDDIVYIDSAGGQRTVSNLVQIVTKMLNYLGIQNPYTLYASRQEGQEPIIETTADFVRLMNLAEAFNEFMTTGKADQLQRCLIDKERHPDYANLLSAMQVFSDKIRIGDVETLDDVLNDLQNAINQCRTCRENDSIETVILRTYLDVIEDRLLAREAKKIDYLKIIQWCLDNSLIQQALTLYVEKVPAVLFDRHIIKYDGNYAQACTLHDDARKKNPALPSSWEMQAVYTEILGCSSPPNNESILEDPVVNELRDALRNGIKSKSPEVIDVLRSINAFASSWRSYKSQSPREKLIADLLNRNRTIVNIRGLKAMIANQEKTMYQLLYPQLVSIDKGASSSMSKTIEIIQTKLDSINQIVQEGRLPYSYSTVLDISLVAKILMSYVYAKVVRNRINHASSEENLSRLQKETIETYGINLKNMDLPTILHNLQNAVAALEMAIELAGSSPMASNGVIQEKKKIFSAEKIIENARARIGLTTSSLAFHKPNCPIANLKV